MTYGRYTILLMQTTVIMRPETKDSIAVAEPAVALDDNRTAVRVMVGWTDGSVLRT